MQKLRASHYALVGLLTLVVAFAWTCYHFYDLYRRQVEAELQRQNTMRLEKAQLDVSALAILSEIERMRKEKEIADLNVTVICIATGEKYAGTNFSDPSPDLLQRLKTSAPKIRPYSNCRPLVGHETAITFLVSNPFWETTQSIEISVRKSRLAEDIGISEVYLLTLINDHWIIEGHWPGPPE